jgi:hypothetical protein
MARKRKTPPKTPAQRIREKRRQEAVLQVEEKWRQSAASQAMEKWRQSAAFQAMEKWCQEMAKTAAPSPDEAAKVMAAKAEEWKAFVKAVRIERAKAGAASRSSGKPPAQRGRPREHEWRRIDAEIARRIAIGKAPIQRTKFADAMLLWCLQTLKKEPPRSEMINAVNVICDHLGYALKHR